MKMTIIRLATTALLLLGAFCVKASSVDTVTMVTVKVPKLSNSLSMAEVVALTDDIRSIAKEMYKQQNEEAWIKQVLRKDTLKMPFSTFVYGEKPENGYPLFVSLHGGGGTTAEVNDVLYQNQQHLYDEFLPSQCIYMAPRSPFNTWDLWFKPEVDTLLTTMINLAVINLGADPNRVYLMGYSAGGDGVWRLAPRLADRWAAATTMAGHPGDVNLINLRTTPFMMCVGEHDDAYNRNRETLKRLVELDSLAVLKPENVNFYKRNALIASGKGHWMELEDASAIPWMQQFTRKADNKRMVWQQEEVTERSLFWLSLPETVTPKRGDRAEISIDDNVIYVERCDYPQLTIWLNDDMVNLDENISVIYDGKAVFRGKVPRKKSVIEENIFGRNDFGLDYCAKLTVVISVGE